jgi:2-iminobutanoate/2-iminopropanoate deaminase
LENIVMCGLFASNAGFYPTINKVYARYFAENPPSRTFVPVGSWPMEFDIEIECTAVA